MLYCIKGLAKLRNITAVSCLLSMLDNHSLKTFIKAVCVDLFLPNRAENSVEDCYPSSIYRTDCELLFKISLPRLAARILDGNFQLDPLPLI